MFEALANDGILNEHLLARLAEIEQRDSVFPDIDPCLWAEGSCDRQVMEPTNSSTQHPGERPKAPAAEQAPAAERKIRELRAAAE